MRYKQSQYIDLKLDVVLINKKKKKNLPYCG